MLFSFFYFTLFYFTILYWFCHTSTWICHGCTCVPNPETPSHLPPHTISLGHPSAPAPSILYPASNLDWWFVSYMMLYMFQCHSPKSSHPPPLPQSPKVCSIHLCLFCCLAYRVSILNHRDRLNYLINTANSTGSLYLGKNTFGLLPCTNSGRGNGNPLQYSCLENTMDRGALWATVHGVAKCQTRLKWLRITLY